MKYGVYRVNTVDYGLPTPEKKCPKCGEWWPADADFYQKCLSRPGKMGIQSWCRACMKARTYTPRQAIREPSTTKLNTLVTA